MKKSKLATRVCVICGGSFNGYQNAIYCRKKDCQLVRSYVKHNVRRLPPRLMKMAEKFLGERVERQRGRKGFVAPVDEKDTRPCPRCGKKTVNRYLCHGCWDDRYRWDSGPDIFEAYEEANTL